MDPTFFFFLNSRLLKNFAVVFLLNFWNQTKLVSNVDFTVRSIYHKFQSIIYSYFLNYNHKKNDNSLHSFLLFFECKIFQPNRRKRRQLFRWLHVHNKFDIISLQETFSSRDVETVWKADWGGDILYSHSINHSRGVMILFNPKLDKRVDHIKADKNGRYLLLRGVGAFSEGRTIFQIQ